MGRRRSAAVWVDGQMWDSSEAYHEAMQLAVEITGPEIQQIDALVRYCEQAHRRGRPDINSWDKEKRRLELVRRLYERAGAATGLGDGQTAPLTVAEIKELEQIRHDIHYYSEYYLFGSPRDPMLDQTDDLLNRLHFLVGHARVTESVGGVAVFPENLQIPSGWGG